MWPILPPGTAKVAGALAGFMNKKGRCFPHMKTLAKAAGMTDRAVRLALGDLEAAGLLVQYIRSNPKDPTKATRGKSYRWAFCGEDGIGVPSLVGIGGTGIPLWRNSRSAFRRVYQVANHSYPKNEKHEKLRRKLLNGTDHRTDQGTADSGVLSCRKEQLTAKAKTCNPTVPF
jgi:hypothetical protein